MSTTVTIHYQGVPERGIPAPAPTTVTVPVDIPVKIGIDPPGDFGYPPEELSVQTGADTRGIQADFSPKLGLSVRLHFGELFRYALPDEVPEWTQHLPAVHAAVVAALADAERNRLDVHTSCELNRVILRADRLEEESHANQWLDSRTGEYVEVISAK
jgi:hypothetical protein